MIMQPQQSEILGRHARKIQALLGLPETYSYDLVAELLDLVMDIDDWRDGKPLDPPLERPPGWGVPINASQS